jgi:hypothetical protein
MRCQTLLVFVSLVIYLLVGGLVFWHLESRYEIGGGHQLLPQHRRRKSTFVDPKTTVSVDLPEFYTELFDYVSKELDRQQQQLQLQQQQHGKFVEL